MTSSSSLPFTPTRPPPLTPTSSPISLTFPIPPTTPPEHRSDVAGRIAVLTLSNPTKLNAVGLQDVFNLIEALTWLGEQDRVTIVVVTGEGRFFSSGAMLDDKSRDSGLPASAHSSGLPEDVKKLNEHYVSRITLGNGRLARVLSEFPKVLVGAMNGPAVGIMAAFVGHCDLLWAYENFWLNVPFTQLGLVCEGLASQTFVAKMGLGRAQECLLEGKRMDARTLAQTGFITRLLPTPPPPSSPTTTTSPSTTSTLPILNEVLTHIGSHLMPPLADPYALTYSKRLIQRVTYDGLSREEANQAELRGAERVFTSGVPLRQFARMAEGTGKGKGKKSKM